MMGDDQDALLLRLAEERVARAGPGFLDRIDELLGEMDARARILAHTGDDEVELAHRVSCEALCELSAVLWSRRDPADPQLISAD